MSTAQNVDDLLDMIKDNLTTYRHVDPVVSDEQIEQQYMLEYVLMQIGAEVSRAREKFPGDNVTFAATVEEMGEVATAIFEEPRKSFVKECTQLACMAVRLILDGDHTYEPWRKTKGLDSLECTKFEQLKSDFSK